MSEERPEFDLDAKGLDVFQAIYEHGGKAVTTEIKQFTGIEKNAIVLYRLDKMEEQGLIEVGVGESDSGRMPPKEATLTEKGRTLAESGLWSDEEPTILDRLDRAERQVKVMQEEFQELSDEFRKWKYDPEEDREVDVTDLLERLEKFEALTEGIDDDAMQEALSVAEKVDEMRGDMQTKSKYLGGYTRSIPFNSLEGKTTLTAFETVTAITALEDEILGIVEALEDAGIEPSRGRDEFLVRENQGRNDGEEGV